MKTALTLVITALALAFSGIEVQAGRNTDRLVQSIKKQQKEAEKQIIKMWMSGKRGKEFEIVLAEYVAREVRYRAMTGSSNTGTLLSAVNKGKTINLDKPAELGRLIVLEHFKRKGIDLKDKNYVKGSYQIGLK